MRNKFQKNECGASLVEYALLIALISVVTIGAVRSVGWEISNQLQAATMAMDNDVNAAADGPPE